MFVLVVTRKSGIVKSCSSFEDLSAYKISLSHIDLCKFCIHLRSLNVCYFGMFAPMGLKNYDIEVTFNYMTSPLNFIQIYQVVQKLI
jgi:hypothetical protein